MIFFSAHQIILLFIINLSLLLTRINVKALIISTDKQEILSRHKRENDEGPDIIKIKIQIDSGVVEEIELSKLKHNFIANEHLKVWIIHKNMHNSQTKSTIEPNNNIRNEVGDWDFYQNKTSKSAVVYFRKSKLLGGIVGEKRYLLNFINYDGAGDLTVIDPLSETPTRTKRDIEKELEKLANFSSDMKRFKRSVEDTDLPNIEFYLESLVIISGNLTNSFSTTIADPQTLKSKYYVMHVLAFFNLLNVKFPLAFKINIAGILLREKTQDLPFLEVKNILDKEKNQLRIISAREEFEKFLGQCESEINSNNYDYAIHLTDYTLHSEYTDKNTDALLSYPTEGICESRKSESPNSHAILITSSSFTYTSICHAAHQIYHVIAAWNFVEVSHNHQNFRIINDNIHEYDCFFRWNKDWCAFINEPHTLGSIPRKLLTLDQHCLCYSSVFRYENSTTETAADICANGFQCRNLSDNTTMKVITVINGTPCGENKVCWDNNCVSEVR